EAPDDFLLAGHFEKLGVDFASMGIADDEVAAGKKFDRRHPRQRDSRELVLVNAPDDLAGGRDFDDPIAVAAGDERIAVLQTKSTEHLGPVSFRSVAGRARAAGQIERVTPHNLTVRIVFADRAVPFVA